MTNKNIKQVIGILTVMAAITGCGGSTTTGNTQDNTNNTAEKKMVVSTYTENAYLRNVAVAFEKQHPDVDVIIEEFRETGAAVEVGEGQVVAGEDSNSNHTLENYMTYLNTAFMGNEAPDLLMLNFLPKDKYSESGYLVDLTSKIENDSEYTDDSYYMNVLKGDQYKNAIYAVPMSFNVTMRGVYQEALEKAGISGDLLNDEYWNLNMMKELLNASVDKAIYLEGGSAVDVFYNLYKVEGSKFLNFEEKSAKFDSEEFITLLNECKKLEDEGKLYIGEEEASYSLFTGSLGASRYMLYQPEYIGSAGDTNYTKPLANEAGEILLTLTNEIAITKDAKDQELCFEFIKMAMSEEMQKDPELESFAVNKNADRAKNAETVKMLEKELKHEKIKLNKSREEIVEEVNQKVDTWANMPCVKQASEDFDDIVLEEVQVL